MNRITAKRIILDILDRWNAMPVGGRNVRFVVVKNRVTRPGQQDAGHLFSNRREAMRFAKARYGGNFALLALTEHGTVDVTPA